MISLGLPRDPSEVVAIGKVAIRHGQLDHGLKLTIGSIRGLSVEQALAETKRKSVHQLQALVEEHARVRFGEAPTLVRIRELLHLSRQAADYRNSVLNDFWAAESDAAPIHALKKKSRASSRAAELESVADNLLSVVKELDHERHHGCLHETTEAFTLLATDWLTAEPVEALKMQRPAPDNALKIVATGEKEDPPPGAATHEDTRPAAAELPL